MTGGRGVWNLKASTLCNLVKGSLLPHAHHDCNWSQIWKIQTPTKENLIWRACSDTIPTIQTLCLRRVSDTNRCPGCGAEPEDPLHALVTCPKAAAVWNTSTVALSPGHVRFLFH